MWMLSGSHSESSPWPEQGVEALSEQKAGTRQNKFSLTKVPELEQVSSHGSPGQQFWVGSRVSMSYPEFDSVWGSTIVVLVALFAANK